MACSCRTTVQVPFRRTQGFKYRLGIYILFFITPNHNAVPFFKSPNAAGYPGVYIMNAFCFQLFRMANIILIITVAPFNKDIPCRQELCEYIDMLINRAARGQHKPYNPGGFKLLDKVGR